MWKAVGVKREKGKLLIIYNPTRTIFLFEQFVLRFSEESEENDGNEKN